MRLRLKVVIIKRPFISSASAMALKGSEALRLPRVPTPFTNAKLINHACHKALRATLVLAVLTTTPTTRNPPEQLVTHPHKSRNISASAGSGFEECNARNSRSSSVEIAYDPELLDDISEACGLGKCSQLVMGDPHFTQAEMTVQSQPTNVSHAMEGSNRPNLHSNNT